MQGRHDSITFALAVLGLPRGTGRNEVLLELLEKLVRVGKRKWPSSIRVSDTASAPPISSKNPMPSVAFLSTSGLLVMSSFLAKARANLPSLEEKREVLVGAVMQAISFGSVNRAPSVSFYTISVIFSSSLTTMSFDDYWVSNRNDPFDGIYSSDLSKLQPLTGLSCMQLRLSATLFRPF